MRKSLVIGDVHGHFDNLRGLLLQVGAINENNERINQTSLEVVCSGDLVDGDFNREGDLKILEYAPMWFDKIVIGNHEWAFLGGVDFGGLRRYDRDVARLLYQYEHAGLYVPATVVQNFLVVHGGLSNRIAAYTEQEALELIMMRWELLKDDDVGDVLFDGIGFGRWGNDDHGGIFWLDWNEARNTEINQIVGHSTIYGGPKEKHYHSKGTVHWNIDLGGKHGYALGGVLIDNGVGRPVKYGDDGLLFTKNKGYKFFPQDDGQAVNR